MSRQTRSQYAVLKLLSFVEEHQTSPLEQTGEIELFALDMAAGRECAERNISVPEFGNGSRTPAMKINYFRESIYKYYGNLFDDSQVPAGETECYRICLDPHEDWLVWLRAVSSAVLVRHSKPPNSKRANRAANIEALLKLTRQHLRDSVNHAVETWNRTGTPDVLPPPHRRDFALQLGLTEPTVSKCFSDDSADELNRCWEMLENRDQIMQMAERRRERSKR